MGIAAGTTKMNAAIEMMMSNKPVYPQKLVAVLSQIILDAYGTKPTMQPWTGVIDTNTVEQIKQKASDRIDLSAISFRSAWGINFPNDLGMHICGFEVKFGSTPEEVDAAVAAAFNRLSAAIVEQLVVLTNSGVVEVAA